MAMDGSLYLLVNLTHLDAVSEMTKAKNLIRTSVKERFIPRPNLDNTQAIVQIKPSYDKTQFVSFSNHAFVIERGNLIWIRRFVYENIDDWYDPDDDPFANPAKPITRGLGRNDP